MQKLIMGSHPEILEWIQFKYVDAFSIEYPIAGDFYELDSDELLDVKALLSVHSHQGTS